ncbi:hypothetical protein MLD38_032367 [Melastoma candidum]|uniref:Uncharacterized protein n=1 Tax=Melastoma candidum TaxID=119954 RepID=A0ACB9M5P0_9MYRT|nr:hypothetical protein MLD38_032367 [Melastoma candidum]
MRKPTPFVLSARPSPRCRFRIGADSHGPSLKHLSVEFRTITAPVTKQPVDSGTSGEFVGVVLLPALRGPNAVSALLEVVEGEVGQCAGAHGGRPPDDRAAVRLVLSVELPWQGSPALDQSATGKHQESSLFFAKRLTIY